MLSINGKKVSISAVKTDCKLTPLTVKENGTYFPEESDGFNKVVVDVEAEEKESVVLKPLTITENGTYEGGIEDGKQVGFNPVVVDVKQDKAKAIKELIDLRGSASYLFNGMMTGWTNETLKEWLRYDSTENALNLDFTFANWGQWNEITELPMLDTKKVISVFYCLDYAHRVKVIPAWDLRNATLNTYYFIRYAYELEEIWIRNIKAGLCLGFRAEWGTKIKKECLIHIIYECRDTGSANTLNISYASDEILNSVHVRLVDITDEMRAEDDLIDEKLPFEVCESTDEGAMPIKEYALLKNWQIAL